MFLHVDIIMVVHVHSAIWLFILMKCWWKRFQRFSSGLMFLYVDVYTRSLLTTVCRDRPMKLPHSRISFVGIKSLLAFSLHYEWHHATGNYYVSVLQVLKSYCYEYYYLPSCYIMDWARAHDKISSSSPFYYALLTGYIHVGATMIHVSMGYIHVYTMYMYIGTGYIGAW